MADDGKAGAGTAGTEGTISDRLNPTHPAFDAAFQAQWKGMSRKQRNQIAETERSQLIAKTKATAAIKHPFPAEEEDHCETDPKAYADISTILHRLCEQTSIAPGDLKIYDPYYCTGAVVEHLAGQGFKEVYNKCEDFYKVAAAKSLPKHDIIVTNPAYSGDHIPRMLQILRDNGKPFCALMPEYVYTKGYFASILGDLTSRMLYLVPNKRYVYWTPKGLRQKAQSHSSRLGNRTSPFHSFWYIYLGATSKLHDEILRLRSGEFKITKAPLISAAAAKAPSTAPVAGVKRRRDGTEASLREHS